MNFYVLCTIANPTGGVWSGEVSWWYSAQSKFGSSSRSDHCCFFDLGVRLPCWNCFMKCWFSLPHPEFDGSCSLWCAQKRSRGRRVWKPRRWWGEAAGEEQRRAACCMILQSLDVWAQAAYVSCQSRGCRAYPRLWVLPLPPSLHWQCHVVSPHMLVGGGGEGGGAVGGGGMGTQAASFFFLLSLMTLSFMDM